ncbi:MAG: hypothetical protein HKP14_08775 [Bacteroidia bacterium]|nr:hypothetical protein [Bacteroidia bacterium]
MKVLVTLILLFLLNAACLAQTSIGIIANPNLNLSTIKTSSTVNTDSIKNIKKSDFTLSIGLEFRKQIDRYQAFSVIPTYYQTNLLLVQEDLQLFDVIHPTLDEIRDLSQAALKTAFMHHRFKYAGIQLLYSKAYNSSISNSLNFEFAGGLSYMYLLKQDIRVRTEGFALNDEFIHIVSDSILFEGRKHNAVLNLGSDMNYTIKPNLKLVSGISCNIPLLAVSKNQPKLSIYNLGLKVGLRKIL